METLSVLPDGESLCVRWSTVQRSHWCSKRKNARKR